MWAILGNVSLRGLGLLGSIFVARFLGSEIFGEYGAIKNTIVSIAIFSTYGLGYTATKYVADFSKKSPASVKKFIQIASNITLLISLFISILTLTLSDYIAVSILNNSQLSGLLAYVSIWIVFNALTTLQIGFLSGLGAYKAMAKINTIVGFFTFLSSLILTWLYSLNGAIFALIISQIFNWMLYFRHIKSSTDKIETSDLNSCDITYKQILLFSFPIALQEMVYSITSWLSCVILIKFSDYSQLGIYTASMQWSAVVLFIPVVLRNVALSNLSKQEKKQDQLKIVKKMVYLNIITTLIPSSVILLFAGFITKFYGNSFEELQSVLFVALLGTIFISVNSVYSQAYMSIEKNWMMFFLRLLRDGLILLLTVLFILNFADFFSGALALVWATLIANAVFMVLMSSIYIKLAK
jgi:O-antigen/teichoic acid export membrane protein